MSAQLILKINLLKYKSDRYTVTVDHKTTDKRSTAKMKKKKKTHIFLNQKQKSKFI